MINWYYWEKDEHLNEKWGQIVYVDEERLLPSSVTKSLIRSALFFQYS